MTTANSYKGLVQRTLTWIPRLFMVWLFGDVVLYAIIPIGMLGLLTGLLGRGYDDLWLFKEWSFANIVFFGTSICRLTRLKIELQRTPGSYQLDAGVQLFIVMLIAAALTLALVVLREWDIVPAAAEPLLGGAQALLFAMGIMATFAATLAEEFSQNAIRALPGNASRPWLLRQAAHASGQACDSLIFAMAAAQRAFELGPPSSRFSARIEDRLVCQLLADAEGARDLVEDALNSIKSFTSKRA